MAGKTGIALIIFLLLIPGVLGFVPVVGGLDNYILPSSSSVNIFYNNGFLRNTYFINDSTTGIGDYETLLLEPNTMVSDTDSIALVASDGLKLIDRYVTPVGSPGATLVKGSEWRFFNYATVDSAAGANYIVIVGKLRFNDGSFGTEFVNTTSEVITSTSIPQYTQTRAAVGRMYLNSTDRIAIEYYGKTTSSSSRTLTIYHCGTEYSTHLATYT